VPRFFFDVHENGHVQRDEFGVEFATFEAAVVEAKRALPAIAIDGLLRDGDHKNYTVVVKDEEERIVYTAALSFVGTRLIQ
jgi:hypothetical protein